MKRKQMTRTVIQKRKAIALDVIDQLDAATYHAERETYAALSYEVFDKLSDAIDENKQLDLQKFLQKGVTKKTPCTVCALGSAFISAVRITDKVPALAAFNTGRHVNTSVMRRKLREFFTPREQSVIEACFEISAGFLGGAATKAARKEAAEFESATSFNYMLRDLADAPRLTLLMQAVADLAGERITLTKVRDWFHVELLTNPLLSQFSEYRL